MREKFSFSKNIGEHEPNIKSEIDTATNNLLEKVKKTIDPKKAAKKIIASLGLALTASGCTEADMQKIYHEALQILQQAKGRVEQKMSEQMDTSRATEGMLEMPVDQQTSEIETELESRLVKEISEEILSFLDTLKGGRPSKIGIFRFRDEKNELLNTKILKKLEQKNIELIDPVPGTDCPQYSLYTDEGVIKIYDMNAPLKIFNKSEQMSDQIENEKIEKISEEILSFLDTLKGGRPSKIGIFRHTDEKNELLNTKILEKLEQKNIELIDPVPGTGKYLRYRLELGKGFAEIYEMGVPGVPLIFKRTY